MERPSWKHLDQTSPKKSTCPLKRDHLKGKVCLPNIIQGRAFSLGVPISVVRLENIEKHIIPNGGFHGDESHGRK